MTDNTEKERAREAFKNWCVTRGVDRGDKLLNEAFDAGLATATTEIQRLRKALEDIQNPFVMFRREAEATGKKLDGVHAFQLANNATFLQELAAKALGETE